MSTDLRLAMCCRPSAIRSEEGACFPISIAGKLLPMTNIASCVCSLTHVGGWQCCDAAATRSETLFGLQGEEELSSENETEQDSDAGAAEQGSDATATDARQASAMLCMTHVSRSSDDLLSIPFASITAKSVHHAVFALAPAKVEE